VILRRLGRSMASVHQRYRIIEKIDAGGMAEIYRGEAVSLEGFARQVAIKRILPSMCTDPKFVAMFLDEARLSMQLTHANIVQIFDIGKADDTYFVVMELIDGLNLRRLLQRSVDRDDKITVALACYITIEVAKALSYAHERRDSDGKSLGIVHRDVSPPNVLLSNRGEIKLTDFGLAKAASHVQHSDADVIKGKYSYLSPEVVDGKPVDPRADVYSTGIMLWEMLCGRKLFAGKTDMDTVELVRRGQVPKPSTVRAEVDDELDKIVMKILAKSPKRRFQSARAVEQALAGYLFKHNKRVTASDVASYLSSSEDQQSPSTLDLKALLNAEFEQQVQAGAISLTLGQLALSPASLTTASASRLDVSDMLTELQALPLEDIEGQEDRDATVSIEDRLDLGEVGGSPKIADGAGGSRIWLTLALTVGALAIGFWLWQSGLV